MNSCSCGSTKCWPRTLAGGRNAKSKRYLWAYDKARKLAADSLRESEEEALNTVPEELVQAVLAARRANTAG